MSKSTELSCACANGGPRPCGKVVFEFESGENGYSSLLYVYWYRITGDDLIRLWDRIKIAWNSLIRSDYNYMLADIIVSDKQQLINLRDFLNQCIDEPKVINEITPSSDPDYQQRMETE